MGFLPLQRQGLNPAGRELVCVCSTAGLGASWSSGWHSYADLSPVSSALHIMSLLQSPFRRGNTSRDVHGLLKYTFMKAFGAKVRWSEEASIF